MQHAIMIMSHKNMEQLCHLVEYFAHDCYVFIHLDKKFKVSREDRERLEAFPQVVKVYQKFDVNWGGFSMLRCQLFMMREVLKRCNAEYVHLISSQDYPMKSLEEFFLFFEQLKDKDCLQYLHLPNMRWERNTFIRFCYFHPYDWFHDRTKAMMTIRKYVILQKKLGIKRHVPQQFEHLYGSSQWFSITRKSTQLIVDYTRRHPSLYWRMWMTFAPEESYIATVLVNLKNAKDILFTNHRFIRWQLENGNCPANLGLEHLRYLMEEEYAFVRKMEMPISKELQNVLDKYFVYDRQVLKIMANGGWEYDGYRGYPYNPSFTKAITNICNLANITSVIDVGCGCGIYVAELYEIGIKATGFDANPYTESLSRRLIKQDYNPCYQADISVMMQDCSEMYDLVICKDVIPYIPIINVKNTICNLAMLSNKYILLSWYEEGYPSVLPVTYYTKDEIDGLLKTMDFEREDILDNLISSYLNIEHNPYRIYKKIR